MVFVGEGRVLEYVPVHTSELPTRGRAAHPAGCGFSAATRVVVFSTGQTGRSRFILVDVDSPFTRYYHVLEGRFDGRAPGETPSQTGQSKSAGWVQPTSRHPRLIERVAVQVMVNHVYWPASRLLRRVVAACTGLLPITGGSGGRCASGVCTARRESKRQAFVCIHVACIACSA